MRCSYLRVLHWLASSSRGSRPPSLPRDRRLLEPARDGRSRDGQGAQGDRFLEPLPGPRILPLKTDKDYAHTVKELEPFHHVEPFKTHFRTQLEYTGPGRTLPEPADLKAVKVGFIGPLYPTVSAATGGQEPRGGAGQEDVPGLPARDRGGQRPRAAT